jgi:hypothetical protein
VIDGSQSSLNGFSLTNTDVGENDSIDSDATLLDNNRIVIDITMPDDGASNNSVDIGFQRLIIGDRVWNDANGNGLQDRTEIGFNGVVVTLSTAATMLASTTTDVDGQYLFTSNQYGLMLSTEYVVSIDSNDAALSSRRASPALAGDDIEADSNGIVDGTQIKATISIDQFGISTRNIDFGFYHHLILGDLIWVIQNVFCKKRSEMFF